jgi:Methyltransferase domain
VPTRAASPQPTRPGDRLAVGAADHEDGAGHTTAARPGAPEVDGPEVDVVAVGRPGGERRGPLRRWAVERLVAPLQRGLAEAVAAALREPVRTEVERGVAPLGHRLAEEVAEALHEPLRAEVERAVTALTEAEFRARRDLLAVGERDAALSSAHWAQEHMPTARTFTDPTSTLRHGLEIAPRGGMALEFGVFAGRSLRVIAELRGGREVYGFDSFQGLPADYRSHVREGAFALDAPPEVEGAELVVGWFEDTLPGFLEAHPGPVDFLHVDGDLYSSAVTVLDAVGPRLQAGSVVVFDEFFNFPGWEGQEFAAWQEWLARTGATPSYEAYTVNNEQVVVRLLDPGTARPR